jgi:hypothetical protein
MAIVWELERNHTRLVLVDYDSREIKAIINVVISHQRKWFLAKKLPTSNKSQKHYGNCY